MKMGEPRPARDLREVVYYAGSRGKSRHCVWGATREAAETPTPTPERRTGVAMTLKQACPEYQGAQCAFKDSMIH